MVMHIMQAPHTYLFQDPNQSACFGPLNVEDQLVTEQASFIGRQLSMMGVGLDSALLVQISLFAHQIFQDSSVRVKSSLIKTSHTQYIFKIKIPASGYMSVSLRNNSPKESLENPPY